MTQEQEKELRDALSIWFEVYEDECDADSLYHLRDVADRVAKGNRKDMEWLLNVNTKLYGQVNESEVLAIMREVGKKERKRIQNLINHYDY